MNVLSQMKLLTNLDLKELQFRKSKKLKYQFLIDYQSIQKTFRFQKVLSKINEESLSQMKINK